MRPLSVLLLFATSAAAAPPAVEGVSPPVGQRGTAFAVALTGARLADPQQLHLYTPGLACTRLEARSETEVVAHLTASADCRPGEHPLRLRTAGGFSNLRTLSVTPLPVLAEKEPNNTPATAQPVPLGTTVAGVIESADADHYRVTLAKGQRLTAEVQAIRLGCELLDAAVSVFGPDGKELATADDTALFRQDPFVSLVAPADGEYVVRVRDSAFGGGSNFHYALHVGSFPRPAGVSPLGGPAGQRVEVRFLGEPGVTTVVAAAGLFPEVGGVAAPTPQPFRASPFPNAAERGKPAAGPVAFDGVIARPNEVDEFALTCAAGEAWQVEAFAARMGSPLDTVVTVLDPASKPLARNDDDDGQDSRLTFTAPAAGAYRVRVADKRGSGGPLFAYRLEVTKPVPSLAVFLPTAVRHTPAGQTVSVPRGGRAVVMLGVRRDGCDGPVTLTAGDLPAGVTMSAVTVPAGEYLVPAVVTATPEAKGGALVAFTGSCGGVTGRFRQTTDLIRGPGDSTFHSVTVDRLAVAVVDPNPVTVTLSRPAGPLPVDGAIELVATVKRSADAATPVEVVIPHLPPGVETGKPVAVPADQTTAVIKLTCQPGAAVGTWPIFAEARPTAPAREARDPNAIGNNGLGTGGRRPRRRAEGAMTAQSEPVPLALAPSPVAGKFTAAAQPGKTMPVVVELDSLPAGAFTARLEGLPPKVTAPAVAVSGKRVTFAVTTEASVPPGDHPNVVCELVGAMNGQAVTYRVGRGGVLVVQPAGAATDALSPLDRLRKAKSNGGSR
jgi:hypothetical protein